jgi:SAM-dependent methyltransferase
VTDRAVRASSFGTIAEDYDRLRPSPVPEALDWLVPGDCHTVVDLAAGTGLLTRELARRVPEVIAVEPDERMRAVLAARSPEIGVVEGRGEAIPLPDASADGLFISSAWHWMDPDLALPEIARVVRSGGRFGVLWTSRDRTVDWLRELGPAAGDVERSDDRRRRHAIELPDDSLFIDVERATFATAVTMTVDDLVGALATYSGLIVASTAQRDAQLDRARHLLGERFPGASEVEVPIRSWCWRSTRR